MQSHNSPTTRVGSISPDASDSEDYERSPMLPVRHSVPSALQQHTHGLELTQQANLHSNKKVDLPRNRPLSLPIRPIQLHKVEIDPIDSVDKKNVSSSMPMPRRAQPSPLLMPRWRGSPLPQRLNSLAESLRVSPLFVRQMKCIVCADLNVDTRLPCGHAMLCNDCTKNLLSRSALCPSCRAPYTFFYVNPKFASENVYENPTGYDFSECQVRYSHKIDQFKKSSKKGERNRLCVSNQSCFFHTFQFQKINQRIISLRHTSQPNSNALKKNFLGDFARFNFFACANQVVRDEEVASLRPSSMTAEQALEDFLNTFGHLPITSTGFDSNCTFFSRETILKIAVIVSLIAIFQGFVFMFVITRIEIASLFPTHRIRVVLQIPNTYQMCSFSFSGIAIGL
jgi:hypothetical protein